MPRRRISILIAILTLAARTASATDFWLTKDWKQWSREECIQMVNDSPWAHLWRRTAGADADLLYVVQLRSSLPIRQALVREQQIDQKYDKMTDAQRTSFDSRAEQILNRNFDDTILVHVDFVKGSPGANAVPILREDAQKREDLHVLLTTGDGTRIKPLRVDVSPGEAAFDAIFPKTTDGAAVIKPDQKHFLFQFQSPRLAVVDDRSIAAQSVEVQFDLGKMIVNGKPYF